MARNKKSPKPRRPSRKRAEEAVETLLLWAGEDPRREGLVDTPKRVAAAYEDWLSGYREDPVRFLKRTFEEVEGYDEMIVLRDISFESHCEHHMAPRRLPSQQQGRRHQQAGPCGGNVCPQVPGPGEAYGTDRQLYRGRPEAARRRRRHRCGAPVHDDQGYSQVGRLHGDQPDAGRISQRCPSNNL